MKIRTTENGMKAALLAQLLALGIYTILSILAIYMFGSSLQTDLMKSLGSDNWAGFILSIVFFIVLLCHVPFVFFATKESFLIMVDELDSRSMSTALTELVRRLEQEAALSSPGSTKQSSKH